MRRNPATQFCVAYRLTGDWPTPVGQPAPKILRKVSSIENLKKAIAENIDWFK